MRPTNQTYQRTFINLQLRNIKYLSIVSSAIDSKDLVDFLIQNQGFWGGRYNIIVPAVNGRIVDSYMELATSSDPDYILHEPGFDIDSIKGLFNPIKYFEVGFERHTQMKGVDVGHLLDLERGYSEVIYENYLYKEIPTLYNFYKLNFGFLDSQEMESTRKFEHTIAGDDNLEALNDTIINKNICFISNLSKYNVARKLLIPKGNTPKGFELVIGDSNNQLNDLLYFWNKENYLSTNNSLNTLYMSTEDLRIFLETSPSKYFFSSLATRHKITLQSFSLTATQLTSICTDLNAWQGHPLFEVGDKIIFPFKIDRYERPSSQEIEITRSLFGSSDTVALPQLSFGKSDTIYGSWIADFYLAVEQNSNVNNRIDLPCKPELTRLFTDKPGRISLSRNMSIVVDRSDHELSLYVSDTRRVFRHLILNNSGKQKPIAKIETSDAGMRLTSLLRLFDNNFDSIFYYFQNTFWFNIFRSSSITNDDGRLKSSKGIYSLQDLLREYNYTCEKKGYKYEEVKVKNTESELMTGLADLVSLNALFIGYKVKCNHCGSRIWYSLRELDNEMNCKGCQQSISPEIEQTTYYKVNDIIINNLVAHSGSKRNIHGNYSVIMALSMIKSQSYDSFMYYPSQDYYEDYPGVVCSDIDIICLSDGNLIVGEAKNSVKEFGNKEVKTLSFLAKKIVPNVILLAFNEGDEKALDPFIIKLRELIEPLPISIQARPIPEPWFPCRGLELTSQME